MKIHFISGNHFSDTICLCFSKTRSIYSNLHIYSIDFLAGFQREMPYIMNYHIESICKYWFIIIFL